MLVSLNNEKSAMLVSQMNPEEVELFCNAEISFFIKQIWPLVTGVRTLYLNNRVVLGNYKLIAAPGRFNVLNYTNIYRN